MHKDLYSIPEPKIELNFRKALIIAITVVFTFVIPIEVITFLKVKSEKDYEIAQSLNKINSGRIAGISTEDQNIIKLPSINIEIDLNSQEGNLLLLGSLLIGISIILLIFLYLDHRKFKKRKPLL